MSTSDSKRGAARIARLWRTARHLRPVQVYGRALAKVPRPPARRPAPPCRSLSTELVSPIVKAPRLVAPTQLDVVGTRASVATAADWTSANYAPLVLYNVHYFDDLGAPPAPERTAWNRRLLRRWIDENPPLRRPGWDPYPTSLRLVNIIKWLLLGAKPWPELLASLAMQSRHLYRSIESHLGANHVIANAKGLLFAGTFFAGREAEAWLERGTMTLEHELDEQVLADGGHYERSPMYHALMLEDVLDVVALRRAFGDSASDFARVCPAMLDWLEHMRHPDDEIALFNDAAIGIAPAPAELRDYAARLELAQPAAAKPVHLAASGYARLESATAVAFFDLAPLGPDYQPGHGHADSLSIELSVAGQRLLVNSGTGCYGVSDERLRQRSTAAHNTVELDGQSSSEVWSGFRVGRRARVHPVRVGRDSAEGWHDGYRFLAGQPRHRRRLLLSDDGLRVSDAITGSGVHDVAAYFHFHPSIEINALDGGRFELRGIDGGWQGLVTVETSMSATVEASSYHAQFGEGTPNQRLVLRYSGVLPFYFTTEFHWTRA